VLRIEKKADLISTKPLTVIKAIDRRWRAFFWTGEDSCHGSKCLVAWEQVYTSKQFGGLGIKDLELQNQCMLLKFVDKFFSGQHVPWRDWLLQNDFVFFHLSVLSLENYQR
jgi:hypothetical protein